MFLDRLAVFTGRKHSSVFSAENRGDRISVWRRMKLRMTAELYLLEQDHISGGSGGFGVFASTFNSNPFRVPSEHAADLRS